MTENELKKTIAIYKKTLEVTANNGETCFRELDKNTLLFLEELEQYRAIGTVEDFKALKEKAEPKKPRWHGHCFCPHCNNIVYVNGGKNIYCPNCGQKLDWSE